jgi:tetratricopeptide (TPR) repeat protein
MRSIFIFAIIITTSVFVSAQSTGALEFFNKGVEAARKGDNEAALAHFNATHAAIERDGAADRFFAAVHYDIGATLYKLRRPSEAVDHLDKALRFSKRMNPQAHFVLGLVQFDLGDLEAARTAFRSSIALSQDDAEAWYHLGYVHLAANDTEAARKAFAKAAKLGAVGSSASRNNLGVLLALDGRLKDAMNEFEKAAMDDPTGIALVNLEKCRRLMDNSPVATAGADLRFAPRRFGSDNYEQTARHTRDN